MIRKATDAIHEFDSMMAFLLKLIQNAHLFKKQVCITSHVINVCFRTYDR